MVPKIQSASDWGAQRQTAIVGKWHLGHGDEADPTGFDHWCVLPGQGNYYDPHFHTADGTIQVEGYCTDIITQMSLDWLKQTDDDKPWFDVPSQGAAPLMGAKS